MPVKIISKKASADSRHLVSRLVDELKGAGKEDPRPYVLIEGEDRAKGPIHIYVIWPEWSSLAMQERSNVVMDAYKDLKSRDDVLRVTVAMGLTPEEAPRFGINLADYFDENN